MNKFSWLAFALSFFSLPVLAQTKDFSEPVNVASDNWDVSLKDKKAIYLGNVVVTQGSLSIKANWLEVNSAAGKGKEVFTARGTPAVYSQMLENNNPIQAMANEIHYDVATRVLTLTGNAEINQSGSLVKSEKIQYDLENQKLNAEGGTHEKRVTTIFSPEKN